MDDNRRDFHLIKSKGVASSNNLQSQSTMRPEYDERWLNESGMKGEKERRRIHGTKECHQQHQNSPSRINLFWQALFVILICPYFIADLSNFANKNGQFQKVRKGYTPFGALASTHIIENRSSRLTQAAIAAAAESFQLVHQNQQPFIKESEPPRSMLSSLTMMNASNTNNVINYTSTDQASIQALVGQRWGHTAAFLRNENVILFTGGQVQSVQEGDQMVTNDVFALDMANATIANGDFGGDNSTGIQRWKRLSSNNLPPHAFAARAITHASNHDDERIFLIGGATADCSINNSPVYVWSSGDDGQWESGGWTTPTIAPNQQIPPRRRGAQAVQVPVTLGMNETEASEAQNQGGISFMVLGGYIDYTTCNHSIAVDLQSPVEYPFVDVWTIGANNTTSSSATDGQNRKRDDQTETLSVRTMPIDMRMPNMSMIDYSTVILPANQSAGLNSRVMFIGGRDAYGVFTPMNRIWTLDLVSSTWEWVDTTNGTNTGLDIPLGRMGHSSTLLEDGTILVHGGYVTLDANQMASNDTYLLDPRVAPAVWHKVSPNPGQGGAPSRAYHTAIMANGIFMVGFGQESMGNLTWTASTTSDIALPKMLTAITSTDSDSSSSSDQQEFVSANGPAHFLDTTSTNNWSWSTNLDSLLAMRSDPSGSSDGSSQPPNSQNSQINPSPSAASSSQPSPSAQSSSASSMSSESAKSQSQSNSAATMTNSVSNAPSSASTQQSSSTLPKSTQSSTNDDDTETGSGSDGENSSGKTKTNTAVIASVLGAAAIMASLGGLYAARKRQAAKMNDTDSLGDDDKYERFAIDQKAPPVSSLWINQPMTWANNAGKGLKRQASMASGAFLARTMSFKNLGNSNKNSSWQEGQNGDPSVPTSSRWLGNWRTSATSPLNGQDGHRSFSSPNAFGSFEVLRNLPPTSRLSIRRSEMQRQKDIKAHLSAHENGQDDEKMVDVLLGEGDDMKNLPDDFIRSLLDDDDVQAQQDIRRTVRSDHQVGRQRSILRARSSDTLSSVDGASHFSYPYLADMHRSTGGGLFASELQNFSPTSSQGAGLTENESPFSDKNAKGSMDRPLIISPRQALLRASLSRSPTSPTSFPYSSATVAAALGASNAGTPVVLNALFAGKNGRLSQHVQNMMLNTSPIPNIRFENPFMSAEDGMSETLSPFENHSVQDEMERPTTELDMATTVLGGIREEEGENRSFQGTPTQNSPSVMSALFPWQAEDPSTSLAMTLQSSPSSQPFRSSNNVNKSLSPMRSIPFYQQPSTGVRLPIHPALLNAVAKNSYASPSNSNNRIDGQRRGRPSLLRVTNQSEEQ